MIIAAGVGVDEGTVAFVLLDIALIVGVARLAGALFRRFRQPPVIGEIMAGLLLGGALLGTDPVRRVFGLDRTITDIVFPLEARPFLKVLAELGLILFMFIVGLELDIKLIRGRERLAAGISLTSVALPFVLGIGLASLLDAQGYRPDGVELVPFALFIGASMSVTAFPVLARVLSDRGMHRTPIGALALACAAIDDILAWSLLALVTAIVQAEASGGGGGGGAAGDLVRVLGLSVAFITFMFVLVRPQLARLPERYRLAGDRLTPEVLAFILGGVLLSSWATSMIGIHAIFGAFLFGAVLPREGAAAFTHDLLERIESVAVLLLLPLFFIVTGINVEFSHFDAGSIGTLVLIVAVACLGKFAGATAAGRLQGLGLRRAAAIGILMNTRGLTELVLLTIGRDKGVLDDELFTLLVLMAVITTVITAPLLRRIYPDRMIDHDIAEAERAALGAIDTYRVLVLVDAPSSAAPLVTAASAIAASEPSAEVVLTRLSPQPHELEVGAGAFVTQLTRMAASLDDLRALEEQVRSQGLSCAVFSRFTDDLVGDLAAQAGRMGARLVVVGDVRDDPAREAVVATIVDRMPCDVAVVVAPLLQRASAAPGRPPVVEAAEGPDGLAAIELGLRMASAHGALPAVVGLDRDGRGGRQLQGVLRLVERDGGVVVTHATDLTDPQTVEEVGLAAAVLRSCPGAIGTAGSAVHAARPDTERLGFPVILVRADRNQLERASLSGLLDARRSVGAHTGSTGGAVDARAGS